MENPISEGTETGWIYFESTGEFNRGDNHFFIDSLLAL